jgi:hypothetical protein
MLRHCCYFARERRGFELTDMTTNDCAAKRYNRTHASYTSAACILPRSPGKQHGGLDWISQTAMDTHCHFREAVQDGLWPGFFFLSPFFPFPFASSARVPTMRGVVIFAGLTTWALFFLFCVSNGYLASFGGKRACGFSESWRYGARRRDSMLFPRFQYIMRKPLEVVSLLLCLMSLF